MDAQLEEDLVAMGIASPVTKATAGALYQQELSRQARPGNLCMRCRRHQGASFGILYMRGPALPDEMRSGFNAYAAGISAYVYGIYTADICLSVALFKSVR